MLRVRPRTPYESSYEVAWGGHGATVEMVVELLVELVVGAAAQGQASTSTSFLPAEVTTSKWSIWSALKAVPPWM